MREVFGVVILIALGIAAAFFLSKHGINLDGNKTCSHVVHLKNSDYCP